MAASSSILGSRGALAASSSLAVGSGTVTRRYAAPLSLSSPRPWKVAIDVTVVQAEAAARREGMVAACQEAGSAKVSLTGRPVQLGSL